MHNIRSSSWSSASRQIASSFVRQRKKNRAKIIFNFENRMKCEPIVRMYFPRFQSQNDRFFKNIIIIQEGVEVADHFVMFCVISSDSFSSNDVDLAWGKDRS